MADVLDPRPPLYSRAFCPGHDIEAHMIQHLIAAAGSYNLLRLCDIGVDAVPQPLAQGGDSCQDASPHVVRADHDHHAIAVVKTIGQAPPPVESP